MNNQIILKLENRIKEIDLKSVDIETQRNIIKEELQYYVLNFIYHHPEYSNWTMYGGSALRICHKLDRMSVDLDFEIDNICTEDFLNELKKEIQSYFLNNYSVDESFLTIKVSGTRGLRLNFHIVKELSISHTSDQVHVKIDLNCFTAPKTVTEMIPINYNQLSFVIKTYNMSALMASKIAAILLRGTRGIGKEIFEEKGRDIYDLLWYMNKKIIPDMDYLIAKGIDISDLHSLFNKLTFQMNKVNDKNLLQDLKPLFIDQTYINNWLKNWLQTYFNLLKSYSIYRVTKLKEVNIFQNFLTDIFSFVFFYETEEGKLIRIIYTISDYWFDFRDGDLSIEINKDINKVIHFSNNGATSHPTSEEKLKQYATLFYNKMEDYFKKTKREVLSEVITTKVIRMTADNLNRNEEIVLTKSALESCDLDDLLK